MLNRHFYSAVCVCLAASVAALGQPSQYVFQLPGGASTSGQKFFPYVATGNPLAPVLPAGAVGPVGTLHVIPKPDGSKFYLIGTPAANALQTVDPTFTSFKNVTGLGSERTKAAAITPDGKSLLVGTDADTFYIIDTNVDSAASGSGLSLPGITDFTTTQTACAACWIAVSQDSSTAYVLTNFAGASRVSKIDIATRRIVGSPLILTGDATAIGLSPLGLLYVSAANVIYEINPATVTVTAGGTVQLAFDPGPLRFTPDGTLAFAANKTPAQAGHSILELTIATRSVQYWPPVFVQNNPAPLVDDVLVASNTSMYAVSSTQLLLYDVSPTPLTVTTPSALGASTGLPALVANVSAGVVSNELPSARFLFLSVNNGSQYLYRVDLATGTINTSALAALTTGIMEFAAVPPQTGVGSFLQFNNPQTLGSGATSKPFIARVLTASGQPVFNVPVAFSVDSSSGIVVNTPSQTTNADGYVQTTVTMPAAPIPGSYTLTLSAGGVVTTFTVNVAGAGGGGGGGGAISQVTIVSGDGQLVDALTPTTDPNDPLTLLVTDTAGNPLPNVPVGFSIAVGSGNLYGTSSFTDQNGLASTNFQPQVTVQQGTQFQAYVINATTQYGSVNFAVTALPIAQNQGTVNIEVHTINPSDTTNTVPVGQGEVTANGATAKIYSNLGTGTPIPGVGMHITELDGFTPSAAAACQGSSLSDKNGIASCNVFAKCQPAGTPLPKVFPVIFRVGDNKNFFGGVQITQGHASKLNLVNGDAQSGKPAQLSTPLLATVTDGCTTLASGIQVSWAVTKGSATLENTTTVSDTQGRVSTQVRFGQSPGPIQVQASFGTSQVVFNLTNQVVIGGITLVSGGNQTAIAGQQFANALVFVIRDVAGNPVPGTLVNFSVTSGSAGVNPASQSSSPQGTVSTSVTAGASAGNIVITATVVVSGSSATAALTSQPPGPVVTALSFVNADSLAPGLVPCGRATVTAPGIVPNLQGVHSGVSPLSPLPYALEGFSLAVNGTAAPIESVSNLNGVQSATFQTPCEVQPGTATIVAQGNGGTTTVTGVQVFQAQPGVHNFVGPTGKLYGYVICSNGTITPTNFAHREDTCYVVVTGLGQTTPAASTNNPGVAGQNVNVQAIVGVNNVGVPVVSAQYLQGWNGFYLVGFTIPSTAATGPDQPLAVAVVLSNGEIKFGNPVFLPGVN